DRERYQENDRRECGQNGDGPDLTLRKRAPELRRLPEPRHQRGTKSPKVIVNRRGRRSADARAFVVEGGKARKLLGRRLCCRAYEQEWAFADASGGSQ